MRFPRPIPWLVLAVLLASSSPSAVAQSPAETVARFYTKVNTRREAARESAREVRLTSLSEAMQHAPQYDILFGNFEPGHVAPLKGRKAMLKVLLYELPVALTRVQDDFAVIQSHEEWFVHDAAGRRITTTDEDAPNLTLLDIGHPQYRAYEIDYIIRKLAAAPFDGIFLDLVHPHWAHNNRDWSAPVPAPVLAAWGPNMLVFLQALKARLPAGRGLWWNGIPTTAERARGWAAWEASALQVADGTQMDGFCYNRRRPFDAADVAYQLRRAVEVAAAGRMMLLKAAVKGGGGPGGNLTRLETFCYAAFLLVADGRHVFYYPAHDLNRGSLDPVRAYRAMLGPPLGPLTRPGALYRRDFVRGSVVVNPTGAPLPISLPAGLISAVDGRVLEGPAVVEAYGALIAVRP